MFVVDGWRMTHTDFHLLHLDPTDIQAVSIVKGLDAVRRYGEGTGDGVVIVTTRAAASP